MKVLDLFTTKKISVVEESLSQMAAMPSKVTYSLWCCDEEDSWNKWAN